jgi:hypothetical protein
MRERAHQKGKEYQILVKSWIHYGLLLGFELEFYGDAYDITQKATEIGGTFFDFSLKLSKDGEVKKIAYVECKYREESIGIVNTEFRGFIQNVYSALLNATRDEGKHAEFFFISNIPPDQWRHFLNNKIQFLEALLKDRNPDAKPEVIYEMLDCVHILVLSEKIISRG